MRSVAFFLLVASCAVVPETKPDPPPVPPPRTMTIEVPADCPHMMVVDILSTSNHESEITVACFAQGGRTYMMTSTGPPVGSKNEPDIPTRLVIDYVPRSRLVTTSGPM